MTPWAVPGFAQAPERLSDKDVKALIDQVDEGRDKFEGNLDGQFKGSTLRGPAGETKVAGALQDYQDNTKKLQERFTADYSASAEVTTVLKQSTSIDTFMQGSSSAMKGRSEWDRQVVEPQAPGGGLRHHVSPARRRHGPPDERQGDGGRGRVSRHGGGSLQETTSARPTRSRSPSGTPPRRTSRCWSSRPIRSSHASSDGKPATGEVRQLVEQAAKVQTFVDAHPIPTAVTNWQAVQTSVGKLQQAFGLVK